MESQTHRNADRPWSERISDFFGQFVRTILLHKYALRFIQEHKPWEGLQRYGWIVLVMSFAAVLLSYQFFSTIYDIIRNAITASSSFEAGIATAFSGLSFEQFNWMLHGGKKYLILIILELITFHFIQRTLEIRLGRMPDHSIKAFLKAEKRLIIVSFVALIMENITRGIVGAILGIFGLHFMNRLAGYGIQFFFLGFTMIDNYHECFRLTISESQKRTLRAAGAAVAIGGVAYILMFLPLIGVLLATMLGAVTACIAMEYFLPVTPEDLLALETVRKKKGRGQKN
jgi:hypothetical protein